jgi:integrase
MSVFKRGNVWWFEYEFCGARIRESARTKSRTLAIDVERQHRRKREESAGEVKRHKVVLFSVAAKAWLNGGPHWSDSTREIYTRKLRHLLPVFGKKLITDIENDDIAAFQRNRKRSNAAASEINKECAVLRMILRKHRIWHQLAIDYRPLREAETIGKALSADEMMRLLKAARNSRSQSIYPAIVLLQNTGLRVSELRTMQWRQVDMTERCVTVGKAKTRGGEGRMVPLNQEAFSALAEWRENFSDPLPEHFVFPSERYGLKGFEGMKSGMVAVWDRDPNRPIGSWKTAWGICRRVAKVDCRLHDLRHTFVSRLAEGQNPDQTIMALAGHVSRKMMERYSHVRNEAKRKAVEGLCAGPIAGDSMAFREQ